MKLMLYQADLNWSAGVFFLLSLVFFAVPAYAVYFKSDILWLGLLIGLGTGICLFRLCSSSAAGAWRDSRRGCRKPWI